MRDYLAKAQPKREEKEKTQVNIPLMKTFEKALLLPQEMQTNITQKQYPETGMFLMENPFPKKKKKGTKMGKKSIEDIATHRGPLGPQPGRVTPL